MRSGVSEMCVDGRVLIKLERWCTPASWHLTTTQQVLWHSSLFIYLCIVSKGNTCYHMVPEAQSDHYIFTYIYLYIFNDTNKTPLCCFQLNLSCDHVPASFYMQLLWGWYRSMLTFNTAHAFASLHYCMVDMYKCMIALPANWCGIDD